MAHISRIAFAVAGVALVIAVLLIPAAAIAFYGFGNLNLGIVFLYASLACMMLELALLPLASR